jgi:hypothetical protein
MLPSVVMWGGVLRSYPRLELGLGLGLDHGVVVA